MEEEVITNDLSSTGKIQLPNKIVSYKTTSRIHIACIKKTVGHACLSLDRCEFVHILL